MEYWNAGILGLTAEINYLNCQKLLQTHHSIIPLFQLGEAPNFVLLPPEIVIVYRIKAELFTMYDYMGR